MSVPIIWIVATVICVVLAIIGFRVYRRAMALARTEQGSLAERLTMDAKKSSKDKDDKIANSRIAQSLAAAGSEETPIEFIGVSALIAIALGFIGLLVLGTIGGIIGVLVGIAIGPIRLRLSARGRGKTFDAQLSSALPTMAQMLRSGSTMTDAMKGVASTAQAPLADEFSIAAREIFYGAEAGTALEHIAERTGSKDLVLLSTAVKVNAKKGGDLADTIDTVANAIRERQSLKRMVQAETSSSKTSVIAIVVIELAIFGMCFASNEIFVEFYLTNAMGLMCLVGLLIWEIIGIFIMLKASMIDVG